MSLKQNVFKCMEINREKGLKEQKTKTFKCKLIVMVKRILLLFLVENALSQLVKPLCFKIFLTKICSGEKQSL